MRATSTTIDDTVQPFAEDRKGSRSDHCRRVQSGWPCNYGRQPSNKFTARRSLANPGTREKLGGQKVPFKLKENWAIRIRLQLANRQRELALSNLAIDSKLRACDLVKLPVRDVCHGGGIPKRGRTDSNHRTQCLGL
jgi:hypothetical protein